MRITCPNCGAQYEVPAEVIPDEGRDVQCSNCGDTWFQNHPDHEVMDEPQSVLLSRAAALEKAGHEREDEIDEDEFDPAPEAETDAEPRPGQEYELDDAFEDESEDDDAPIAPPARPRQRELNPSVAEILREEAEFEARRRQSDAGSLESQGELGLDSAPGAPINRQDRDTRDRMARMRGEPVEELDEGGRPRTRSRLLPDIEEINSTLRSKGNGGETQGDSEPESARRRSGGFTRGFGLILILGIVLVLVYMNAGKISASVPSADGAVNAYVAAVDNLRVWLDSKLSGFIPE